MTPDVHRRQGAKLRLTVEQQAHILGYPELKIKQDRLKETILHPM
ncbi:hypothetical protein [Candidatus Flexifilum breve]